MMALPSLAACPFCGSNADVCIDDCDEPVGNITWAGKCNGCGARGPCGDNTVEHSHVYDNAARRYVPAPQDVRADRRRIAQVNAAVLWNSRSVET